MSWKQVNCPHCGKIVTKEALEGKQSAIPAAVKCPNCGSQKLWRDGLRKTPLGVLKQRYFCRDCALRFS